MFKIRKFTNRVKAGLTRRRSAKVTTMHIIWAILFIVILAVVWKPLLGFLKDDRLPDDGIYSIGKFRVLTQDKLDEGAAVTASAAFALMPDGNLKSASTLGAGYAEWTVPIKEGDKIVIEVDSATNYYPQVRTFTVGDINAGTYDQTYLDLGVMDIWGMDASSDAGVVTVMSGVTFMFNGTGEEDTLAVDAATEYPIDIDFDWRAATEEYFGVEEYTQISANKYTYVPVIRVKTTELCVVDEMTQDGVALTLLYHTDDGAAAYFDYQMLPIEEDEDLDGSGKSSFSFVFTPVLASADTIDITFHDEARLDRAKIGILPGAVETVAQLTTG